MSDACQDLYGGLRSWAGMRAPMLATKKFKDRLTDPCTFLVARAACGKQHACLSFMALAWPCLNACGPAHVQTSEGPRLLCPVPSSSRWVQPPPDETARASGVGLRARFARALQLRCLRRGPCQTSGAQSVPPALSRTMAQLLYSNHHKRLASVAIPRLGRPNFRRKCAILCVLTGGSSVLRIAV